MSKAETEEKRIKRKAKELKELEKWKKEQARPKRKFYLLYLMVVLCLVFIVDTVATEISVKMKAEICHYLFDDSTAVMDLLGMLASAVMIAGAIYKSMSDRFGRKIFLVINTVAMGLGMFIVYLAGEIGSAAVYVIGSLFITFFIAHDMQAVYVIETVPSKYRFTILSIVTSVASLGSILIPVLRRNIMGNNTELWNKVFLIPAILGAVVGLIAMITARETDVFLNQRIKFLEMTDEQREAEKEQRHAEAQAQGGLGAAFRFAFRHKQLRWIFICTMVVSMAMIGTMYYQQIMTYGYEAAYGTSTPEVVTDALMVMPIIGAIFTLVRGFISDIFGRKTVAVVMASLAVVGMIGLYLGVTFVWNPVLVGLFTGIYVSGYWCAADAMGGNMSAESSPTNLRASIIGAQSLCNMVGMGVSFPAMIAVAAIAGNNALGIACLFLVVIPLVVAITLFLAKVAETKGIDLNTVRGDEWD
ncbi:MAG TPA: MFS transporter [Clostridia bacterium]|jgi:MFS family permease|nr:MFS transporter [Clostridiaceae bacterium]HOF27038.1 MFS transporter [Clostridia bacterium]HOM34344.1 MFS transporter [Clostridia bacterium]HOR89350.1 MFS transporter [Clostridia bacterium]HOT70534.1 MFS transporter [Clostridia bacterium]